MAARQARYAGDKESFLVALDDYSELTCHVSSWSALRCSILAALVILPPMTPRVTSNRGGVGDPSSRISQLLDSGRRVAAALTLLECMVLPWRLWARGRVPWQALPLPRLVAPLAVVLGLTAC